MSFRWRTLYPTTPLPRTPPWAPRNPLSSPASPHKPGRLPTPGAAPPTLPLQPPPDCLRARPPPLCPSGRRQQGCTLPCPPEPLLLSLLPDPPALLPEVRIHPRGLSPQGSILHPICPSRSFRGRTAVRQTRRLPLLVLDRGGPCPLGVGAPRWGANILLPPCHIRPQRHIPLLPRHRGPHPQCHGGLSRRDHGDLRPRPHSRPPPDPTRLPDCTQHHPIRTKCHLRPPGLHPCLVDLTPTVEPEGG